MPELIDKQETLKKKCETCGYCESLEKAMRATHPDFVADKCNAYKFLAEQPAIEAEPVRHGRWIPVDDALPEEDVSVMCYMRIGEIVIMEYAGDGWYSGITRYNPRAVTHWMPLPEPPESEVQDDAET